MKCSLFMHSYTGHRAKIDLRNELSGQVGLSNVLRVVRREVVARQTKWARPELGPEIHLAV